LRAARDGSGALLLLSGESGVGKTRLLEQIARDTAASEWTHATGTAYEVEGCSPYGLISDALTPLCERMDANALTVAARGLESDLAHILPFLARGRPMNASGAETNTKQTQWHFTHFLHRLGERSPLLLVLENVHWADASSLELLHFIVRHLGAARLVVVATYPEEEEERSPALQRVVRSLMRQVGVQRLQLAPLSQREVAALIKRTFDVAGFAVDDFAGRVYAQARGNPFFTEEILTSLVERGALRLVGERWVGWDADVSQLTATGRAIVRARLSTLSDGARNVAGIMSAVGTRVQLKALQHITRHASHTLEDSLEELVRRGIVAQPGHGDLPLYDFTHPIVRSVVYEDLGVSRAQAHHVLVFEGLEALYGGDAELHATELAPHLTHAAERVPAETSVRYFAAAGCDALGRRADVEADRFLTSALEIIDRNDGAWGGTKLPALLVNLARAKQRLGAHAAATALLLRSRDLARAHNDPADEAEIERTLGLVALDAGAPHESLVHFEAAEERARAGGVEPLAIRSRIARATTLQSLGKSEEGRRLVLEILPAAESLGDAALSARAHRAMVQLYSWTGPASEARRHGALALQYASVSGDQAVAWSVHWALALMAGLAGDGVGIREHQLAAEQLANELKSPLRLVWSAELGIEYASAVGLWGEGLALAERVLPIARALAPKTLLPRLLVWMGIMLIERDEMDRAHALFRESWELADVDNPSGEAIAVHVVVPACIGMATYHLRCADFGQAVSYADRGLALADGIGAFVWAIHRLLPILCEALIGLGQFERAAELAQRLREQSRLLEHPLGLAYADATEAVLRRYRDQQLDAHSHMLRAAELMEAVPVMFPAARLRLNAAQLLAADGLPDDAARELRSAYEVLSQMGAVRELGTVRERMRLLGVRPPKRSAMEGESLSGRQGEIVELVVLRKTNKEIATALGMSPRTVDSHLRAIFTKLGVDSRGAVADVVRERDGAEGVRGSERKRCDPMDGVAPAAGHIPAA
jgi:DNA-binding CsgD family transcriptional regulator